MFRSGFVSIIGKPNVGKSTLLNTLVGQKISIVTSRPQTTRNRILGIKNLQDTQIIFVDTPGIHKPTYRLGEILVREAVAATREVDIIFFLINPERPDEADLSIIETLRSAGKKTFLVINKIDLIPRGHLLPLIEEFSIMYPFDEILPISALKATGIDDLLRTAIGYLPEGPQYYPIDMVSDQLERFMISEVVREKIMYHMRHEIPHTVATEVTDWKEKKNGSVVIHANIYIEKDSQKGIIIGKRGSMLKTIGTEARKEIEDLLNTRVHLQLFVKVKKNWRQNATALRELGFH